MPEISLNLLNRLWKFTDIGLHELGGNSSEKEILLSLERENLLAFLPPEAQATLTTIRANYALAKEFAQELVDFLQATPDILLYRDGSKDTANESIRGPFGLNTLDKRLEVTLVARRFVDTFPCACVPVYSEGGYAFTSLYDIRRPSELKDYDRKPIPVALNQEFHIGFQREVADSGFYQSPIDSHLLFRLRHLFLNYRHTFVEKYGYLPTILGHEAEWAKVIVDVDFDLSRSDSGRVNYLFKVPCPSSSIINRAWLEVAKATPNFWDLDAKAIRELGLSVSTEETKVYTGEL